MVIIILNRLSNWYDEQLLDQQQGFRCRWGTTDCIFVTKRIQQISEKFQKPIMLLFVDLSSAFDHVIRKWLFKSIYQRFLLMLVYHWSNFYRGFIWSHNDFTCRKPWRRLQTFNRCATRRTGIIDSMSMEYVMSVYMERCKAEGIKFFQMKYRIRTTSTTREEHRGVYYGEHTIDWSGYADDLKTKNSTNCSRSLQIEKSTYTQVFWFLTPL